MYIWRGWRPSGHVMGGAITEEDNMEREGERGEQIDPLTDVYERERGLKLGKMH